METLRDKALYLVRTNPKGVSDKSPENDIYSGEIRGGVLDTLASLVANLYAPVLKAQKEWGKTSRESAYDCVIGVQRFGDTLTSAAHSLQGGVELIAPDLKYVNSIDLKPQAFSDASADPSTAAHFETILTDWCDKTEALLDASEESYAMSAKEDAGPDTEVEYWRGRMAKFNSIIDQTKTDECRLVLGVCMAARSHAHKAWKQIDLRLTDASNEVQGQRQVPDDAGEVARRRMYARGPEGRSWTASPRAC